jgi:hypothetical protein
MAAARSPPRSGPAIILSAKRDTTECSFGWIVVETEATIAETAGECQPTGQQIAERGGKI